MTRTAKTRPDAPAADAPAKLLTAANPFADGLLDLEGALRACDLVACHTFLGEMIDLAQRRPRAPAEEVRALHDRARSMRVWRAIHRVDGRAAPASAEEIREELRETALHLLVIGGRVVLGDFHRLGFARADVARHGGPAIAQARRDFKQRVARLKAAAERQAVAETAAPDKGAAA